MELLLETKNKVWVKAERGLPEATRGEFGVLMMHVERDCQPEDRDDLRSYSKTRGMGVIIDNAATTLWRFLEYARARKTFCRTRPWPVILAAHSETPQGQSSSTDPQDAEILFDGEVLVTLPP